jgi:hypothetical protein
MAAVLASSVGQQLGAPGAVAISQQAIQQAEQEQMAAEQRNRKAMAEDLRQRQEDRLNTLLQIGEAREELFKQQGDFDKLDKQAKINLNYLNKQQAFLKAREQELEDQRATNALERIQNTRTNVGISPTEAKSISSLASEVYNIEGMADVKGENVFDPSPTRIILTEQGKSEMKRRMLPLIRGADTSEQRQTALSFYLDALRDDNTGNIVIAEDSPENQQLGTLIIRAIPTPAERIAFIKAMGITLVPTSQ